MQTKQGASSVLKHCEHGVKAYNNVAPENGVVGHLLQAGQQPRHDSAAERGQHLQRSRYPTSAADEGSHAGQNAVLSQGFPQEINSFALLVVQKSKSLSVCCIPCRWREWPRLWMRCHWPQSEHPRGSGSAKERGEKVCVCLVGVMLPSSSSCAFPHLPKCLPRVAPWHHKFPPEAGLPQGITHRKGDSRTLGCSLCADLGWLGLHWRGLLGLVHLPPAQGRMSSELIHTLPALCSFEGPSPFLWSMEVGGTSLSLNGDEVLNCDLCISRKSSSEHGIFLIKRLRAKGCNLLFTIKNTLRCFRTVKLHMWRCVLSLLPPTFPVP